MDDPRKTLLDAPLSPYQRAAITITLILSALDGFDILAVTYAAPGFLAEWNLTSIELGFALSMGLVGMAVGSFLLAPLADVFGRRKMIFASLTVMAAGMGATALADSMLQFSVWRAFTGVGIGVMICVINPLAAEYSNARRRDLAVAMMAVGYPIGGTFGGLISAQLLAHFDWRAVFILGAAAALAMFPIVWRWAPEPIGFLIDRPGPRALQQVNLFLARCGHAPIERLPAPTPRTRAVPMAELMDADNRRLTLLLTVLYSLFVMTVYFFLSWTPQLVAELGFTPAVSTTVAVTRDLVGIVSGAALGWAAHYLGLKRLTILAMVGMAVSLVLFGRLPADITALRWAAALAGLCLYGGMIGLYAIIARTFPTHVRASGTGFVIGVGRVTSAFAPVLGGYLFAAGWDRAGVTLAVAGVAVFTALLLAAFPVRGIRPD